jgi:hypothetical protein
MIASMDDARCYVERYREDGYDSMTTAACAVVVVVIATFNIQREVFGNARENHVLPIL